MSMLEQTIRKSLTEGVHKVLVESWSHHATDKGEHVKVDIHTESGLDRTIVLFPDVEVEIDGQTQKRGNLERNLRALRANLGLGNEDMSAKSILDYAVGKETNISVNFSKGRVYINFANPKSEEEVIDIADIPA